jgi:hypothetical protein
MEGWSLELGAWTLTGLTHNLAEPSHQPALPRPSLVITSRHPSSPPAHLVRFSRLEVGAQRRQQRLADRGVGQRGGDAVPGRMEACVGGGQLRFEGGESNGGSETSMRCILSLVCGGGGRGRRGGCSRRRPGALDC